MCKNCGKESDRYFYDKVWRKMVCESCKNLAIRSGIRLESDYEELKKVEKVNQYEGLSFDGEEYEIVKTSDTFGGNLIIKLLNVRTGDELEMILWKPGY